MIYKIIIILLLFSVNAVCQSTDNEEIDVDFIFEDSIAVVRPCRNEVILRLLRGNIFNRKISFKLKINNHSNKDIYLIKPKYKYSICKDVYFLYFLYDEQGNLAPMDFFFAKHYTKVFAPTLNKAFDSVEYNNWKLKIINELNKSNEIRNNLKIIKIKAEKTKNIHVFFEFKRYYKRPNYKKIEGYNLLKKGNYYLLFRYSLFHLDCSETNAEQLKKLLIHSLNKYQINIYNLFQGKIISNKIKLIIK